MIPEKTSNNFPFRRTIQVARTARDAHKDSLQTEKPAPSRRTTVLGCAHLDSSRRPAVLPAVRSVLKAATNLNPARHLVNSALVGTLLITPALSPKTTARVSFNVFLPFYVVFI